MKKAEVSPLGLPLLAYSHARCANYSLQRRLLTFLSSLIPSTHRPEFPTGELLTRIQGAVSDFLREDIARIESGEYPPTVLFPESPLEHARRLPRILIDGFRAQLRRDQGSTAVFGRRAKQLLDELPKYYRRNFHFQTDGYLSQQSAELYDHQVELLFGGTGDAMRRLVLPPLKRGLGTGDGAGLKILEIAAGTGSTTRFVRLTFPKARIVASDLSGPYLKVAQKRLRAYDRIDYVEIPGEALPFQDGYFDAVYSVFLFHELPLEARKGVLREAHRVLKKGGTLAVVDSIQPGDQPDFEELQAKFSRDYHEPFYRNYLEHPLDELVREQGFADVEKKVGLFSRVVSARA
jgi:ubiquinone/menaquinone biosynthesis C-methylase UbiE